jgi:hypothetical protein
MIKKHTNTENLKKIGRITDFSFSMNREEDWGNILTVHEFSDKPSIWFLFLIIRSGESVSIIK